MSTIIETRNRTETSLEHEVSHVSFTLITAAAFILGIWGVACLVSAFLASGMSGIARGYLTAITGM